MGTKDKKQKVYLSDPKRYADIWNGFVYGGEQVLKWQDLIEENTVLTYDEDGKSEELTSDIIMKRTNGGQTYGIHIVENQQTIDYSMPVKILLEEAMAYEKQVRRIKRRNKKLREVLDKQHNTAGEYLYHFLKNDRVRPVTTLVLYWGDGEWDGATTLKELINFNGVEDMEKFIPNYPIRVVNVAEWTDVSRFQTELRTLLALFTKRKNKQEFKAYADEHPKEMEMDKESMEMLATLVGSKGLVNYVEEKMKEEDKKNMGNAIDDLIEDGRNEGRQEGRQEGLELGRQETLKSLINSWVEKGKTVFEIAELLGRSEEDVRALM